MSLGLRPYKEGDAESIITWCSDEDSFYKWSAGILGEYPITLERMEESTRGNIYPWVLFDGDKVRLNHLKLMVKFGTASKWNLKGATYDTSTNW